MSRASLRHVAALAAEAALVAVAGALLLALAWSHNRVFDLTPGRSHTLSDQARRTARRLDRDVVVTAFYSSQDQGRVREMKELLQRFARESSHFRFRMFDLDRSPLEANRLGVVNYDSAVIEGYDRRASARDVDEAGLTSKLIEIIEGQARVALFAVGHGERDPGEKDPRSGLSQAAVSLEAENYRIERTQDLRGGIPAETALVVAAGPRTDYLPSEIEVLRRYLAGGGGLLLLLEAPVPPRLREFALGLGLQPGNDLVVDERNRMFSADAFAPQVTLFNDQILPYTGAPPPVLPLVQSVGIAQAADPGVRVAPFAFTGSDTWVDAERVSVEGRPPVFRDGIDRLGPVPVAGISRLPVPGAAAGAVGPEAADPGEAAAPGGPGGQGGTLVVVGDAEFATNLYLGSLGNRDFFLNACHLAARAEVLIGSRGAADPGGTFSSIHLTTVQARALFWGAVVLLPGAVLAVGLLVGRRRRRSTTR